MNDQNNTYALKYIEQGSVCAEVGVWKGDLSCEILKCKPAKLHLIDPWEKQDVIQRCYSIDQEKMDEVYEQVLSEFGSLDNVKMHRSFSVDVVFPNHYFNWVYLDGDHSYHAVKKDLEFYYPLIKKGGYLCGDDYGLWANKPQTGFGSDGNGGPKPAVDQFVEERNLKIEIKGNQFVIKI